MIASWSRIGRTTAAIALVGLLAAGCGRDASLTPDPSGAPAAAPTVVATAFVSDETVINNYAVHFDGRVFADNQTTFTYTVSGTGVDPSLSHFTVELPPCAPALASYSPTESANINTNPQSGIYGIEWHLSVAKDNFTGRTYSITFPGDVPLGIVRAEVRTEGGARAVGSVFGPCAGAHISGKVFVDVDKNGTRSPEEGGIANVTVTLWDGSTSATTLTDGLGDYDFLVAPGAYTVSVEASTPADDFNEDLFASFASFGPTSLALVVTGDSPGNDFGFAPQTQKLITDLETGVLLTAGKPVKFWKSEIKSAITGGGNTTYTAAQLLDFLRQVQAFGLPAPFMFTPGSELQEAHAILSVNKRNDSLGLFLKELLAAELNYFSGNTLIGEADLHEVLILWGEQLAVQPVSASTIVITGGGSGGTGLYEEGGTLLGLLNGSTGGGGGDE